ncbi:MAG: ABC transporter permease subunit, partial [Lachnospiraceae bacterium]|nr:ABC transporter permease subunit [Lachnospiraceae bacterium]
MSTLNASLSMLKNPAIIQYLMKGVGYTLIISAIAVLFGILIGSVLALVRNYCNSGINKLFRFIATFYIELFRNTPLLLWIFICLVFCPTPSFINRKMFGLNSAADVKLLFKG